jgi:hypothetical protein
MRGPVGPIDRGGPDGPGPRPLGGNRPVTTAIIRNPVWTALPCDLFRYLNEAEILVCGELLHSEARISRVESAPREPSSALPTQRVLIPRRYIVEMQNVLRKMGYETRMRDD